MSTTALSGRSGSYADGALSFARFAYPPNELGLCGPADSGELLERLADTWAPGGSPDRPASTAVQRTALRHLARQFEGAWPYLQLIAAANQISDPLDPRVVDAYWIGNALLGRVPVFLLGNSLDDRFRPRTGRQWAALADALERGAQPHHNFHVFCVYPWVGLLRVGGASEPLRVLDRCRIRWGQVEGLIGDQAMVRARSLEWTAARLRLGPAKPEAVTWRRDGSAIAAPPRVGATVALHWDWVVQELTHTQARWLRGQTTRHLTIANESLAGL